MVGQSERSEALDALRGVAIALVVAWHYFAVPLGWAGVDLFFVLSGYLLGDILLDNAGAPGWIAAFYARRVARIMPLYWLLLAVAIPICSPPIDLAHYLLFIQNFDLAAMPPCRDPLVVTWSLAVEEQFYLALPLLIRLVPRAALPLVLLLCIATAPMFRIVTSFAYDSSMAAYVLLPCRMDALCLGVLIAWVARHDSILLRGLIWVAAAVGAVGLVAIVHAGGFSPAFVWMWTIGFSCNALIAGGVLLCVIVWAPRWGDARWLWPLSALGVRAYSVYLFHQLVGDLVRNAAVSLAVTALVAVVAWVLIERPCIAWARARWRYGRPGALPLHPAKGAALRTI